LKQGLEKNEIDHLSAPRGTVQPTNGPSDQPTDRPKSLIEALCSRLKSFGNTIYMATTTPVLVFYPLYPLDPLWILWIWINGYTMDITINCYNINAIDFVVAPSETY
jgi:hypothetical protein